MPSGRGYRPSLCCRASRPPWGAALATVFASEGPYEWTCARPSLLEPSGTVGPAVRPCGPDAPGLPSSRRASAAAAVAVWATRPDWLLTAFAAADVLV